ncbi:unnamed protein product [Effrenium voratum]|uniref:Uncharacterized protein n=1 Tax=Effrenium voratum TaxID=2562239 RepID=A0AA36J890_9DINO|nr:unnamed protein product [Effrenium voratum]CAJ1421083.1 unnamed protein product [Effrenium voratum]
MAQCYTSDGGFDWDKYNELVKGIDILTYDPPQKKPAYVKKLRNFNFFTPRSPYGAGFPFCVSEGWRCYIRHKHGYEMQDVYISDPEAWFLKMLEPPKCGNFCPDLLKGVWWMQDNIANETLVSWESAHWGKPDGRNPEVGMKSCLRNWTTGNGLLGTVIMNIKSGGWQGVRISPDRKWINLGGHDFIYLLDEKDHLVDPQGKEVSFRVGEDFLRVSYQDGDPKKGIDYQYLLRRVAFKDAKGQLQKTPIYEQLLDQATRPTAPYGACCNLFLCNLSDEEYGAIYDNLDDHQILIPGPETDLPWHPDLDAACEMPADCVMPPWSSIISL